MKSQCNTTLFLVTKPTVSSALFYETLSLIFTLIADPTTRSAKRSKTSRLPVKASTPRPHSRRVSARDAPPGKHGTVRRPKRCGIRLNINSFYFFFRRPVWLNVYAASSRIATDVPIEPPAIAAPNPPLVILDCQCQHAHERPRPTIPPNPSSRSPHITITVQDFHAAHNLLLMQITKLNNTEQEILNCRHLVDAADEMLAGLENDFTILKDLRVRMEDWVAGWKGDQTLPPRYVM